MRNRQYTIGVISLMLSMFFFPACKETGENPQAQTTHVHGIIPLPRVVNLAEGNLQVDKNIVLVNNTKYGNALTVVESALSGALLETVVRNDSPTGIINIQFVTDGSVDSTAYQIDISAKGITVKCNSGAGAYYAAQSIRQMIWNSTSGKRMESFNLRLMTIKDKPQFEWRGFHLDVSRHFFSKEYILKIIDWLAYYKLNKLHLHLTDDQGWRIEIDQYPLLTQVGAWRTFNNYDSTCMELAKADINYTIDKRFIRQENGTSVYGGFYTKQDIRDIVAYASDHFIEVIPEVDMPGHMSAAIRAYPELSCVDSAGWGTEFSFPICPCEEEVMNFSYKVWEEIAELFPSKYMHIGCDEVEKGTWEVSAQCQAFMIQNNMSNLNEIQNYFVKKLQEHLQSKGKTVIAWDDVIEGSIDSKLIMMYWREWVKDSPERSAANGNNIILTPWEHFYMANENSDKALQKLYEYNADNIYPATVMSKVKGVQSCLWTEIIPSEPMFEYYVFPGMQALAEVGWCSGRNWYSFQMRMKPHFDYLNNEQIHYRRPGWLK